MIIDGKRVTLTQPDSPAPQKVMEVAKAILADRPDDPFGHYYVGRAQFRMHRNDLAMQEFRLALATGKLPSSFERVAKVFLTDPVQRAFVTKIVY